MLDPKAVGENIELPHAVQQGQDRRLRTDRFRERRDGALQIVGLATEDDEAERFGEAFLRHERRRRMMEIADAALDGEAMFREQRGAARTNEKRDVPTRVQEPSAEIAADRARPNDENSHCAQSFITRESPSDLSAAALPSGLARHLGADRTGSGAN